MASIKEYRKDSKSSSFYFTTCLGRDSQGKQIRHYTTWTPPKGMTPAKARKEAEKQAVLWEESLTEQKPALVPRTNDERRDDFVSFVEKVWFPLQVSGNDRKAKTVAFYESTTKTIKAYFSGCVLQDITAMDIEKFLLLSNAVQFIIKLQIYPEEDIWKYYLRASQSLFWVSCIGA